MQVRIGVLSSLLSVMSALSIAPRAANAQVPVSPPEPRAELAVAYSFLHSNAPPGGCACFNLNGGSATLALPVKSGTFAFVGDIDFGHNNGISSGNYTLTLGTFTAGVRYRPLREPRLFQPFAQILVGLAYANGSLVQGTAPAASNAGGAFAASAGGGVDLRLNQRFSLRLVEADYLATTFDNGVNNHQNIFHIGAGLVFHF